MGFPLACTVHFNSGNQHILIQVKGRIIAPVGNTSIKQSWLGLVPSVRELPPDLCLQVYLMGEDRNHVQLAGNQKVLPL